MLEENGKLDINQHYLTLFHLLNMKGHLFIFLNALFLHFVQLTYKISETSATLTQLLIWTVINSVTGLKPCQPPLFAAD